jgi:hypothetical protein
MVKAPPRYLVPIKSYSKNTHPSFFFEMGSILDGRPLRGKSSTVPVSLNFLFIDEIVVR